MGENSPILLMAILDDTTLDFISSSAEQSVRLGVRLGELLLVGDLICLSGELGTGKTIFAQGIGRGWGATQGVTSPTFVLVNEYPKARDKEILYHIDCYRLNTPTDVFSAGIGDVLDSESTIMIEWPERIINMLPEDRFWLNLRYISETKRGLRFKANGDRAGQLLKDFRKSAFGV
jgi:tRNA threonylcarbamoyladenosine biosynthesis protein TsaE